MTQSTPLALELEAGSDALDTCDNSQNTPYCDGSHTQLSGQGSS